MYHGAAGPLWLDVLLAAQDWGVPPWVVTGEDPPNRIVWFKRWQEYRGQLAKRNAVRGKHGRP